MIFGDSAFAQVAYEYFRHDSEYDVAGFTVTRAHLAKDRLFDLPVVPFEEVTRHFPPATHDLYVALVYKEMNERRKRFVQAGREQGYRLASYVSSRAFVWDNVVVGEHAFIFENNVVQPFARLGDNVVLWSGNHVGHHSRIGSHCFLASHVVVSGLVDIGESCFLGVNATVGNNVKIGERSLIGAGALVLKDCPPKSVVKGAASRPETGRTSDEVEL